MVNLLYVLKKVEKSENVYQTDYNEYQMQKFSSISSLRSFFLVLKWLLNDALYTKRWFILIMENLFWA